MLKQKVISQKLGARNSRMRSENRVDTNKKSLYKLKLNNTMSNTQMNYNRIKDMEERENQLLEKLKNT